MFYTRTKCRGSDTVTSYISRVHVNWANGFCSVSHTFNKRFRLDLISSIVWYRSENSLLWPDTIQNVSYRFRFVLMIFGFSATCLSRPELNFISIPHLDVIFLLWKFVIVPIFLSFESLQYYPSLNRSRCCLKGICTGIYYLLLSWVRWLV